MPDTTQRAYERLSPNLRPEAPPPKKRRNVKQDEWDVAVSAVKATPDVWYVAGEVPIYKSAAVRYRAKKLTDRYPDIKTCVRVVGQTAKLFLVYPTKAK